MKTNKTHISYFAKKHNKIITRPFKWDEKCREWISQKGIKCCTYFDVDQNAHRTATGKYIWI